MSSSSQWLTLYLANILTVLVLVLVFQFRKDNRLRENAFFFQQRWSIGEAAAPLILILAVGAGADAVQHLQLGVPTEHLWVALPLIMLLVLWSFFYYVGQPFSVLGAPSNNSVSLIIVGLKTFLWIEVIASAVRLLLPLYVLRETTIKAPPLPGVLEEHGLLIGGFFYLLAFFRLGLISGIEEIVHRGLLYGALRRKVSMKPAIVISSLVFMLGHGFINVVAFALGFVLAYLYERYRSLIPGIIVHVAWNFATVFYSSSGLSHILLPRAYHGWVLLVALGGLMITYFISFLSQKPHSLPKQTRNGDRLDF